VPRGNIWTGAADLNGIARPAIAKSDGCQKLARRCHVSKNDTVEEATAITWGRFGMNPSIIVICAAWTDWIVVR
jgi:hypothetical protein